MTAIDAGVLNPIVARVRTDKTAVRCDDGVCRWTDEPLTRALLEQHLNGGQARGCCPIKAGSNTTRLALLDLDAHKGETAWPDMQDAAERLITLLEQHGLAPIPFRSRGGSGIHLIMIWDDPQDAHSVRKLLAQVLAKAGYTNGTAGISRGQVEIFPKQDAVPAGRFGSMFILPLAGQSVPLDSMIGLVSMEREEAAALEWPLSKDVPVVPRGDRLALVGGTAPLDAAKAQRALAAIPNTLDHRDDWFKLLCAFKEAAGEDGVQAALDWSAQHASHDESSFYKTWDSITVGRAGGAPAGYLYARAEANGWMENVLDDFDVIVPDSRAPAPLPAFVRDGKGRIEATLVNLLAAVRRPDVCGMVVGYDQFNDCVMQAPASQPNGWRVYTDEDHTRMRETLTRRGFKEISRDLIRDAVALVAQEQAFDAAQVWLKGLPEHDRVGRVDTFLTRYMGAEDTPYVRAVSRYLWTALAGRVLEPGCQADMALVLVGAQGVGKTSGVKALVPDEAQFTEINLACRDENLARSLRGKLVGELGELRGLAGREAEDIKQWLTRRWEAWIPKYKEFETKFPRRLVFIGTTNEDEFLVDTTGNRRWLPVRVSKVDVAAIERDRDQLWAEARDACSLVGVMWHEAEELAPAVHQEYMAEDAWAQEVQRWLNEPAINDALPLDKGFVRTGEILQGALGINPRDKRRGDELRIGRILRELGFKKTEVRHEELKFKAFVKA